MKLGPFARNALSTALSASAAPSSRFRSLTGLLLLLPGLALADPPAPPSPAAGELCLPAIAAAERDHRIPAHLLRSIAFVESGRTDPATGRNVPWPWAINVGGRGYFYDSKEEVIEAVRGFQARGIRSIDVGCAQINLMHHASAFASLEEAFDPQSNTKYAARFLSSLHRTTRNWPMAAAGYHSQTPNLGFGYARKVMAIWPNSARYGTLPMPMPIPGADAGIQAIPVPSIYTPEFAAVSRRIDENLSRGRRTRTGTGTGTRPSAAPNVYTPEFAAVSRRIDEDMRRRGRRTRIVTDLEGLDRASEPLRVARRDFRQDPG
ncbi:transglycosylase SLT domain-containing protein [Roseomonas sp. SSH11]|uniref:Transglycosylase SLT domain-containing protein n=1 Tax=Pararoseomonas baculiformis TaxID=2820812 RepID=A0ABS4AHJ5_9PROT|nr:transglycosylase SLT domain-containing protein [Pararoseomonas baculiformis]MBP0446344.1 transglycosylase SLT domain-containing protein [Pararoseomonas baculiformis]